MVKAKINKLLKQTSSALLVSALIFSYFTGVVSAAPITSRSVVIGSSLASASTTYSFTFTVPSSTVIKSAGFAACTTPSGACTVAPGFSASTSTLVSQPSNLDGAGVNIGWVVNTATPGELRISKIGATLAPTGSQTVSFSGVTNPSTINSSFYIRITTYSDSSWTSGATIDTGVVAFSTAGQVAVSVIIEEALSFTLGGSSVLLTTPTVASTGFGTSTMTVSTNAASGYSLSYSGNTLTSGSNTITAMSSPAASTINTKQFGLNLVNNTTPAVGVVKSGSGTGVPTAGYNVSNQFKFNPAGDLIASATVPTNTNTFTASYIANMDGATAAGVYATILTYVATANF